MLTTGLRAELRAALEAIAFPLVGGDSLTNWRGRIRVCVDKPENGNTTVEFIGVAIMLVFLFLGVMQVYIYMHTSNIAVSAASQGARYAANANVDATQAAERAEQQLAKGIGPQNASRINCEAVNEPDSAGFVVVKVSCQGNLPMFFAPIGGILPFHVSARAIEESEPDKNGQP